MVEQGRLLAAIAAGGQGRGRSSQPREGSSSWPRSATELQGRRSTPCSVGPKILPLNGKADADDPGGRRLASIERKFTGPGPAHRRLARHLTHHRRQPRARLLQRLKLSGGHRGRPSAAVMPGGERQGHPRIHKVARFARPPAPPRGDFAPNPADRLEPARPTP